MFRTLPTATVNHWLKNINSEFDDDEEIPIGDLSALMSPQTTSLVSAINSIRMIMSDAFGENLRQMDGGSATE